MPDAMKRYFLFLLIVSFSHRSLLAFGQAPDNPLSVAPSENVSYDPASFATELHRIAGVLQKKPSANEAAQVRDSLPQNWTVSTPQRTYSISSEPLQKLLASQDQKDRDKAQIWLNHLAAEVDSAASSTALLPDPHQARSELDRILAKPQFAAVHPPGASELLRRRVVAWLFRMLDKLFGGMSNHPFLGKSLFWLIMIGGVVCIAFWLFRFWSRRERLQALQPSELLTVTRTWQEWIRMAREAASRGDFREAVHSSYWTGIVWLEDAGVVPRDRTKTPREYLRMLSDPAPGELSPRPVHREPLAKLTSGLERIWYANLGATPEDFQDSLRQLKALGCQWE